MAAKSPIEWTDATWTPLRARVKVNAAEIARQKGYTSLVQIATKMAGHVGPHCERVSPECDHCYSETNNCRCLTANGTGLPFDRRARDLVDAFVDENILHQPLHWRRPKRIFVESQSDLFGEWYSDEMLDCVFVLMALCPQHTFQVLTKRADRMQQYFTSQKLIGRLSSALFAHIGPTISTHDDVERWCKENGVSRKERDRKRDIITDGGGFYFFSQSWPLKHVWLGVSCGGDAYRDRIEQLKRTPAAVRFVSAEPLIAALDADLSGIDWLIAGGESGASARPMHPDWARSLRDQCATAGVAFFFKQWGAHIDAGPVTKTVPTRYLESKAFVSVGDRWFERVGKHRAGRLLDGVEYNAMPGDAIAAGVESESAELGGAPMMKCCTKGCATLGEPHAGFDFFVCEPCLDALANEMERLIGKDSMDAMFQPEVTA